MFNFEHPFCLKQYKNTDPDNQLQDHFRITQRV
jgi:hypothetical protein